MKNFITATQASLHLGVTYQVPIRITFLFIFLLIVFSNYQTIAQTTHTIDPGTYESLSIAKEPTTRNSKATMMSSAVSAQVAAGGLEQFYSSTGKYTLSADGIGSTSTSMAIRVDKPNSQAKVIKAVLLSSGTYNPISNGCVTLAGVPINWAGSATTGFLVSSWADVTSIVASKINAFPAGISTLPITECNSGSIDGEALLVVFDDPLATEKTIVIMVGAASTTGDNFSVTLAQPINPKAPGALLDMGLGIGFGFQPGPQVSHVSVNGSRLTSSAGGQDDGQSANGALITVGGIGDANTNPTDPNGAATDIRSDDELYNILPFITNSTTSLNINTINPTNDDIIFLAYFAMSGAAIVGEGILLSQTSSSGTVGDSHTVKAIVKNSLGSPIPDKAVTFTITSGPNAGGTITKNTNANGEATYSYTGSGGAGTDNIQACFTNSQNQVDCSNSVSFTWVAPDTPKLSQTIDFAPISDKSFGDAPFTLSATASSGLPVSFRIVSGPATLSGNTVTLTGAGLVVIEASQSGNSTYNAATPVTQTFEVIDTNAPDLAVQSFTLVNALNEQDLMPLTDGDIINLAALPTRFLNIRANTSQQSGIDVYFELSGKQTRNWTELGYPFALFGDNDGDYKTWLPAAGHYTLTATPSTDSGTNGTPATISFTVVNQATPRVTGFTLVNALDEQDLMPLTDGDIINLAALPTRFLNIRANTSQQSGIDVYFELSGKQSYTRNELGYPFALFGDNDGDYKTWLPAAGHYTLTATPSTDSGTKGTPVTISFTVVKTMTASSTSSLQATQEQRASAAAYPNPTSEGRIRVLLPQEVEGELGFSLHSSMGAEVTGGVQNIAEPTKELDFDFSRQMSANGVYFLRLKANGMQTVLKVVRQ